MSRDTTAPARRPDLPRGCGRCNANGHASIAVHHDDRVERWWAYCHCSRGMVALDFARASGSAAIDVSELATRYRQRDGVRAVYVHPTPGQLRLDLREPGNDPATRAKVEAILGSIREARGQPPHPADRWGD